MIRIPERIDYSKIPQVMEIPHLLEVQLESYERLLQRKVPMDKRENIGLVAMKILGGTGKGGAGFRLPKEQYENAIRYALSIPAVACAVIGIENVEELEQAAQTIAHLKPLTEEESHQLAQIGLETAATPLWKEAYGAPLT